MDRSPSSKSFTELPKDLNSVSGSSNLKDEMNHGKMPTERRVLFVKDKIKTTDIQQEKEKEEQGRGFGSPSKAVESLEQHYTRAVQQLESLKEMYDRLDTHNDDLEDNFMLLRTRLDALRAVLVNRLSRAARELRSEVHLLRETVSFLMQDFASDMQWYQQQILNRLQFTTPTEKKNKSSLLLPFATFQPTHTPTGSAIGITANKEDTSNSWDSPMRWREEIVHNSQQLALQAPPTTNSGKGGVQQSDTTGFQEALEQSKKQQAELEQKLAQQRKSHEEHMRSMKALYAQKESTLEHRVKLLEHFLKREGKNAHLLLDDSMNSRTSSEHRKNSGSSSSSSSSSTSSESDSSSSSTTKKKSKKRTKGGKKKDAVSAWSSASDALKRSKHKSRASDHPAGHSKTKRKELEKREKEMMRRYKDDVSSHDEESSSEHSSDTARGERSYRRPHSRSRRRRRRHDENHREEDFSPSDMWNDDPLKQSTRYRDVERRVRAQIVHGNQRSKRRNGSPQTEYRLRPNPSTKREEKELAVAASRLLNAVSGAYQTESMRQRLKEEQQQQQERYGRYHADEEDVSNRLYYLRRTPPQRPVTITYLAPVPKSGAVPRPDALSDVSTVARGLWAEKLLLQRSGR
ncbi:uncharacterized protein TM35_000331480 [Trypanosoma theileri]|uniref:Uncharacterized protein n=1 Tax=Trypanosoma theileri TaxID=67003 RepID=A0A1X0NM82_9TRYP|nr:uncharacterized protein TM35_000331480 [Trypanosoma theileri]ORC85691.1 hypothetical protein TM35_000331480 [Trypanosoma theileri]